MRPLLLCLVLFLCANARAATFPVTNTSDGATDGICDASGTSDGCTLREAINAANGAASDDVITFAPGVTGTIQLTGALPDFSTNTDLQGPGASVLTVDGNQQDRVFSISTGTVLFMERS